jgi:hypothetical protein
MHLETFVHHERRSVSATEITYNADGTIQEVPYWLDQQPLKQLQPLNPYRRVEAETMAWGYGLNIVGVGNTCITDLNDGEYIRVRGVDFGSKSARQFSMTAAAKGSATITLHLNSQDGPVIGSVTIKDTGSTDRFRQFTTKVKGATGVHDLYLTFDKTSGDVRLDYWQFK